VFVGFSWGASIGCHLAAHAGDRLSGLALLDAGYTDFQDMPGAAPRSFEEGVEAMRASSRLGSMDAYLDAMRSRTTAWRPALEERVRAAVEERHDVVVVRAAPEALAAGIEGVVVEPPSTTLPALAELELPILLVTATDTLDEPWARAALMRFRAGVPRADVHTVRSGHDLLADAPEETTAILEAWL
jgi:pimeloyl-ACP methyl ester carboxylesterase